jgi:putative ABC transport system ATP-binding protein
VMVGERDVAALDVGKRALLRRREVGFVFQFFHLIPSLTVVENVTLPLVLDGKRSHNGDVDRLLDRMGISHRRDHLPGELSGGEMQRAAIARALVHGPALVLADEPTGNLDSANAADVLDLLCTEVTDAGAALLVVTHDAHVADRADRVCTLRDGRVV